MKTSISELIEQIQGFEKESLYEKAQSSREKVLAFLPSLENDGFIFVADFLVKEKFSIHGVEIARQIEPFYFKLHSLISDRLENHVLVAFSKRQLAKIYAIQGRWQQAIALLEEALPIFAIELGVGSYEWCEAANSRISWYKYIDPIKAKILIEDEWKKRPLCKHLKSVEDYLSKRGVEMWRDEWISRSGVQIHVRALLDTESIRQKLQLDNCIELTDWQDRDNDGKGFFCSIHKHSIEGAARKVKNWPAID